MTSRHDPDALSKELLLRHLIHRSPDLRGWMEHGDVGRDEYHGLFIDASIFQGEDAEQQNIKALWIAVRLLAERVENLDQRSGV